MCQTDLDVAPHNLLLLGVLSLHHGVAGGVFGGEELVGAGRHVGLHGLLVGLGTSLHVVDEGVLEALVALSLSDEGNKSVENKKTVYNRTLLGFILGVGVLTVGLGQHLHHHPLLSSLPPATPGPGSPAAWPSPVPRSIN